MDKEKMAKIKILYYPFKAMKHLLSGIVRYLDYICSLQHINRNKKRVWDKIKNKEVLNVVFVVQYIPGWNKLEPIYTKMKLNDRFNPIIVCVPLNIQNHKLMDNNGNDTYKYFVENGYRVIDALEPDGSWYDLKQLNPDYLFHSRPYNGFMPKDYISSKIVKYTLICNVLYGINITKNIERVTLNKNYYKNCFMYFSLDSNEKKFYENRFSLGVRCDLQKCLNYGGLGIEQLLNAKKEKGDNHYVKNIVWTPRWSTDEYIGGSNFFNYKDAIMEIISKYKDCMFIVRPHPLMFNNFIKTGEMTEDEVNEFKLYCAKTENVILDESKEYYDMFWQSDILITDTSSIVPEYFSTSKPILFCQNNFSKVNTNFYNNIISRCYEVNNENDLKYYIRELINGNDFKYDERVQFVNSKLKTYSGNSNRIVKSLLSWGYMQ